ATHPAGQSAGSGADILAATLAEFQRRNGYHKREIEELLTEFGELLLSKVATAPDSTRTGQAEAEDLFTAIDRMGQYAPTTAVNQLQRLAEAALAARPAAPEAQGAWRSKAADDVLAERRRQVEVERFDAPFDDRYARDELPTAAAIYAAPPSADWRPWLEKRWPWAPAWFKRSSRRRDLVKAGALILAEIERLDRLPAPPASSGQGNA
ncbi:hypothetical protein D8770_28310, partial [Methylobacterium sp. DB1607]|nr:hypothetical protein [Methylobacterium sp. DB1607]